MLVGSQFRCNVRIVQMSLQAGFTIGLRSISLKKFGIIFKPLNWCYHSGSELE